MAFPPVLGAAILALVHVFAGGLRFLDGIPRSRWLSLAGGVSVAYIFVHVLPELNAYQTRLAEGERAGMLAEYAVYLLALVGLVVFYGLERLAKTTFSHKPSATDAEPLSESGGARFAFWVHLGSFAAYNAIVGYLLTQREDESRFGLLWYVLALGLHFVVNDHGLRQHHPHAYHRVGRWVLAGAVLVGWGIAQAVTLDPAWVAGLFAFIAGGTVLNVLKEELPEERESRFAWFAGGAVAYAAVMLAVE